MINIFSILDSVMLSRALFVAANLNIAEHLNKKGMELELLAEKTKTDTKTLKRLLYFLELHEIFFQDKKSDKYLNTEFSKTMCNNHEHSVKPFLLHDDDTRWNAFGNLEYSIKTGKSSFEMLYGKNYFDYVKGHPTLQNRFDEAMKVISNDEDKAIASALSFEGTIADIGGGVGHLLDCIKEAHSDTKGVLFELPEVIKNLKTTTFEKTSGSFFDDIPVKADTFILKRILHDWDDQEALSILKNVRNAMDERSKLYIIDGILDQARDKKLLAAIDLALLTIFQGKERTLSEMNNLLEQANLEIIEILPINDIISAIKIKECA